MEKLFTAIHSLGRPVIYGVISRNGQANIVIGVETQEDETIIKSMIMGLLTGIEVENCSLIFPRAEAKQVLVVYFCCSRFKSDDEKQRFDLSTLMRCLNGKDYTVLFMRNQFLLKIRRTDITMFFE